MLPQRGASLPPLPLFATVIVECKKSATPLCHGAAVKNATDIRCHFLRGDVQQHYDDAQKVTTEHRSPHHVGC